MNGSAEHPMASVNPVARPSRRARRILLPAGAVAALALLSGCAKDAPQDTFQPKGENARDIDTLQLLAEQVFPAVHPR